jgi:sulfur carrier protein
MTTETSCRITVNGELREWQGGSLAAFIESRGIDPAAPGIAVAMNGTVVPRKAWPDTRLSDGDRLELVGIFKGG